MSTLRVTLNLGIMDFRGQGFQSMKSSTLRNNVFSIRWHDKWYFSCKVQIRHGSNILLSNFRREKGEFPI